MLRRLQSATERAHVVIAGGSTLLALALAGCSGGSGDATAGADAPQWRLSDVNVVSRPIAAAGVAAATSLRRDGGLETTVVDLTSGKKLWTQPATMAGRLPGLGVEPPAVVGSPPIVVALEPRRQDAAPATLVARDGRSGRQRWTRPIKSTFGPVACGGQVCLSEQTAARDARFVVLDAASGRQRWSVPGVAEPAWSDARRLVLFRLTSHPLVESYDLATGRRQWSLPVEKAIGPGVSLAGGWAFGQNGDVLVGYLGPYRVSQQARPSAFGFFGVRIADGRLAWVRRAAVRVYPTGNPGQSLLVREVTTAYRYGGFLRLDPATGKTLAEMPAGQVPTRQWWLALRPDLTEIGFLSQGQRGAVYDLAGHQLKPAKDWRGWSFCTVTPKPLTITGQPGFYPVAALCQYDLATGRATSAGDPPPAWYTGSVDGWRLWRDNNGALHAVKDGRGTQPGMYG